MFPHSSVFFPRKGAGKGSRQKGLTQGRVLPPVPGLCGASRAVSDPPGGPEDWGVLKENLSSYPSRPCPGPALLKSFNRPLMSLCVCTFPSLCCSLSTSFQGPVHPPGDRGVKLFITFLDSLILTLLGPLPPLPTGLASHSRDQLQTNSKKTQVTSASLTLTPSPQGHFQAPQLSGACPLTSILAHTVRPKLTRFF